MHFRSGRGFSMVLGLFHHAESEKLGGKISSGPEHAENRRFRRARYRGKSEDVSRLLKVVET